MSDVEPEAPATWPAETRDVYEGLQTYRIVGASVCVAAIMRALGAVAAQGARQGLTGNVYRRVADVGTQFCALKPSTAAYVNAVRWLVAELDADSDDRVSAALISDRVTQYAAYSRESLARIVDAACGLLSGCGHVLIHDYSSTVLAITDEAGRQGKFLTVFVTAGDPVGQGLKVARAVSDAGHRVVYLPDAGIGRVMEEVDLVLSGVETLFRNGDLANTVGTYPIALAAREVGVPVYGVTERMKIHPMTVSATVRDLTARVLHEWPNEHAMLPPGTEVRREVLDLTPARLVTGYVTEEGIVNTSQVGESLERLFASLGSM